MRIENNLNIAVAASLSFLLLLSVSSCGQTASNQQRAELNKIPSEIIYEAQLKEKSIWFTVKSNGCTDVSKFRLEATIKQDTTFVSLVRVLPDYCKARSRLMVIDMKLATLNAKNTKVVFQNPFAKKFDSHLKKTQK
jgi:hypothetical protein